MFDLPPGAERTVQYADFLESRTSFLLVTIPSEVSRGVVARSVAALSKGPFDGAQGRPNRLLGYVENMSGYYCRDCNGIKPLFVSPETSDLGIPCLGTVPFDPELARQCDLGIPFSDSARYPCGPGAGSDRSATAALPRFGVSPMKFLCVPCDTPMKLQSVAPPDRGSLSVAVRVPRVRLRDGDADERVRDASRPVTRRADRPLDRTRRQPRPPSR